MTFCFCIDDDTHVVVHDDVIHRDYSRVINKCGKKKDHFFYESRSPDFDEQGNQSTIFISM